MSSSPFIKQPLNYQQQLGLLQKRGLTIDNTEEALFYLRTISYYRLSAYFKTFELDKKQHIFQSGTKLKDIIDLYQFDRHLRLKILDAVERIEVVLRAGLVQELSLRYGAWWYLNTSLFKPEWQKMLSNGKLSPQSVLEIELQSLMKQKNEEFIKHYYFTYDSPQYPPSWMILECLSFGQCNNLFKYLKDPTDRFAVSSNFNVDPIILDSALDCIRVARNICAHHARLWNRRFTYVPRKLRELQKINCPVGSSKEQIALLQLLLSPITPNNSWVEDLYSLFNQFPHVPYAKMGFQQDWKKDLFWTFP